MNNKKYIPFFIVGLICLLTGGLIGGLITNKKIQRVDVKKIETARHRAIVGMLDQLSWDLISHTAYYCRDGLYEADTTEQGLYQRAGCPEHWELYYSDQWGMRTPKSLLGIRETYSNHPTDYTIHVVAEFLKKINTKRNKESSLIEEGYRDEITITDNEYFEKLIIGERNEYVTEEPVVVATETFVVNRTAEDYARERRELQKSIDDVLYFLNNNIDSNSVDYE